MARPIKLFFVLSAFGVLASAARGEEVRPTAMKLLPAETVVMIRTADAALAGERLGQSAFGRLMADPEMESFVSAAGEEITTVYKDRLQDTLGVELGDLRRFPAGELAFALVERPKRSPALALIADLGDRSDAAEGVLDRLKGMARERGQTVAEEKLRGDTATLFRRGNNQNRVLGVVRRGAVFVIATDRDLLQSLLDRWDGLSPPAEPSRPAAASDGSETEPDAGPPLYAEPLAAKPSFVATIRPCLPGREEPPQLIFYADPIGLLRATIGRRTPVRLAMAAFPALGLDGIQGIGAALWIATEKWDSLMRGHLLLDNPRAGVLKIARLEPGNPAPPAFAPTGLENLFILHADPRRMVGEIEQLVDRFRYEGSFQQAIEENLSERLGVDVREELISNLEGHAYILTGYDPGQIDINGRAALALRQRDPARAAAVLEKIAERFPSMVQAATRGGDQLYTIGPPADPDRPATDRVVPAFGLIEDALVIATSEAFYHRCLDASQGTEPRYAESLQHRLIAGRLKRLAGGAAPSILHFNDQEPLFRHWRQLINSDEARGWLEQRSGGNPAFQALFNLLDRESLPPVETLLKYNAPGGTVVYDTPTGLHLISFAFRR